MGQFADDIFDKVGSDLDRGIYPEMCLGGIVSPADNLPTSQKAGRKGHSYVQQFTGPRSPEQRSTRTFECRGQSAGARGRGRPSAPHPAAPSIDVSLEENYLGQLSELASLYPVLRVWRRPTGLWLRVSAGILEGWSAEALFTIWLPYNVTESIRAWGFWLKGPCITLIEGRHVNPIDGSICAFEVRDHTWVHGDEIAALVDLYALWAFRQLAVKRGYPWFGYQSAFHPFERITQFDGDDACGCDRPTGKYRDCCQSSDFAQDRTALAIDFVEQFKVLTPGKPSEELTDFARGLVPPPARGSELTSIKRAFSVDLARCIWRSF